MNLKFLIITGAFTACSAEASETMRCGRWVVDNQTTVAELIAKCGQPTSKEATEEEVRSPAARGRGTFVVGKTVTERWTYERGSRAFRMVVTIVDGELKSIDRVE